MDFLVGLEDRLKREVESIICDPSMDFVDKCAILADIVDDPDVVLMILHFLKSKSKTSSEKSITVSDVATTAPMEEADGNVFKFGNSDLSDVIFDVGGKKFHCHKMLLAAKSEYFKAMFFSELKEKDQKSITIDADPIAFKRLMEIVYNGYTDDFKELYYYHHSRAGFPALKMWADTSALFELADLYMISDVVRKSVELFLLAWPANCTVTACSHCGMKLLIAVRYGMEEYKKRDTRTNKSALISSMKLTDGFVFSFDDMMYLMERN